jgi:diacylglycerol kinase family enzyme
MPDSNATPAENPGERFAAVVYNPIKVDLDTLKAAVDAAAQEAGWAETRWYETSEEDPGAGQAKQAVGEGAEVVLAAGGDGTIRAVAEGLQGTGVPIALLPSGTGNLLARNLDLALDNLDGSVRAAFTGVDREVDLGVVDLERPDGGRDKHVFLVMAGLGLDAQMLANTDPELKKKVGWLAYVQALWKSIRSGNYLRIRFKLDDEPARTLRVNTILIGNCGTLTGNVLLLPEAAIDDGVFDIVALRPEGLMGWLQIGVKIFWENGVLRRSTVGRKILSMTKEVRTLRYMKGERIVIRPEGPQEFQLDGDPFGQITAVRATVDPRALEVRIPATEAERLPASEEAQAEEEQAEEEQEGTEAGVREPVAETAA